MAVTKIYAHSIVYTVKRHFHVRNKFMRIHQNGPLDKYMQFYLCVLAFCSLVPRLPNLFQRAQATLKTQEWPGDEAKHFALCNI